MSASRTINLGLFFGFKITVLLVLTAIVNDFFLFPRQGRVSVWFAVMEKPSY